MRRTSLSKGGIWFAAIVLAWLAFTSAAGEVLLRIDPEVAKKLGTGADEQASFRQSIAESGETPRDDIDDYVYDRARDAYEVRPLNPGVLGALAWHDFQVGNRGRAVRAAILGQKMSRRNLGLQLVLFQGSLLRGDYERAINELDLGLRTNIRNREIIFEALAPALRIDAFRDALVPVLNAQMLYDDEDWLESFLIYAIDNSDAVLPAAMLYKDASVEARNRLSEKVAPRLIASLVAKDQYVEAEAIALAIPGVSAKSLSDLGISKVTLDSRLGAFAWQASQSGGILAQVVGGGQDSSAMIYLEVDSRARGIAASRLVALPPNKYLFRLGAGAREDEASLDLSVRLRCLNAGGAAYQWRSKSDFEVTIADDCRIQLVQIFVDNPGHDRAVAEVSGLSALPI